MLNKLQLFLRSFIRFLQAEKGVRIAVQLSFRSGSNADDSIFFVEDPVYGKALHTGDRSERLSQVEEPQRHGWCIKIA